MPRFLSVLALVASAASLVALPASARTAAAPPVAGWPQLLHDAGHSSYSAESGLDATNAQRLGINWMSPLRSADLGSPVVAYSKPLRKTVVYAGDERGDVTAYDESNGTTIWSSSIGFGDSLRASPMIAPDGSVWVATSYSSTLFKLDGSTGKVDCSVKQAIRFDASPMLASPPGGVPTVYIATNDAGTISGPMLAIRESDCSTIWQFKKYLTFAGAWATAAYGLDTDGKGRIVFGTADPDSTMYALDATTGALDWTYSPLNPPPGSYDIGAAATISPPGANGFAHGVAYFPTKYGIMYALDLHTGKVIWQYNFNKDAHTVEGGRSAAALVRSSLVFGMANGIYALDAKTGKKLWHYIDPPQQEVISSPAILGPAGSEVVAFGDVTGAVHVIRLSDGKNLYTYQTGNYITSSPAVVGNHVAIDSTDGFLYDFTIGGGNVKPGTTAISFPVTGSSVPNPQGLLAVRGSSVDPAGITEVLVSVQAGGPTGSWYDGATNTWIKGAYNNFVPVKSYGKKQTAWTFDFPVPTSGTTYQVFANTVDFQGQVDRTGVQSSFTVMPDSSLPQIVLSTAIAAPTTSFYVTATGFAPNETVSFSLQGIELGKATADATGRVGSMRLTVPAQAAFGPSALVASGQTSKVSTTAPIDISNAWNDQGFGTTRTGYETNDDVLEKTLQATRNDYVARAWLFTAGAPVNSSPAIVAGSAYVGNDAGQFFAIDTASGAPFWSYTTPNAKPIHGSPAVDGANVVFGSDDGMLYTLASATGSLVGTTQLDGIPTSPAIGAGTIFTATDNGTVYAVNEGTGTIVWSTSVGAAVHTPPSVDLAAGLVVVGDDGGGVSILKASTGALFRHAKTGGAVTAAIPIDGGRIFVGSTDGTLYAFDETSGKQRWSFKTSAAIHAVIVDGKQIHVGNDDGAIVLLDEKAGKRIYSVSFGNSPIVGIAASAGVAFAESADGLVQAIKDSQARLQYSYQTSGVLTTSPAIVDGAVYVGAQDGSLYAFTSYGGAPINAKEHKLFAQLRKHLAVPPRRADVFGRRRTPASTRAYEPAGPREFALHVDRAGSAPQATIGWNGGPIERAPRTYLIAWDGRAGVADLAAANAALRGFGTPAGAVVDAAPYPLRLDDGAVQREIAREFAAQDWNFDSNVQVVVVGARNGLGFHTGSCGYHSAFDLGGNLAFPLPYAFVSQPDPANACGTLGSIVLRERAEMRMDPLLNGWHDAAGNEPQQ